MRLGTDTVAKRQLYFANHSGTEQSSPARKTPPRVERAAQQWHSKDSRHRGLGGLYDCPEENTPRKKSKKTSSYAETDGRAPFGDSTGLQAQAPQPPAWTNGYSRTGAALAEFGCRDENPQQKTFSSGPAAQDKSVGDQS